MLKLGTKNNMDTKSKYIDGLKKQQEMRELQQNAAWERMEQLKVKKELG